MIEHVTRVPPARLRIGHLTFDVSVDQAYLDAKALQSGVSSLAGRSEWSNQRITLAGDMGTVYAADTLLHEVLHQCLRAANVRPDEDAEAGLKDVEERAVGAMAGVLVGVLRDNPELVAYLLAEDASGAVAGPF